MDRSEIEDIVEAILDGRRIQPSGSNDGKPEMLSPLKPFSAFNTSAEPVEVIGVGYFDEMLQFLVIEEAEGEIWPVFREHVFKSKESAQGAASIQ